MPAAPAIFPDVASAFHYTFRGAADKKCARDVHYTDGQNGCALGCVNPAPPSSKDCRGSLHGYMKGREREESDWSNSSRTPIPLFLSMKSVAICRGIKRKEQGHAGSSTKAQESMDYFHHYYKTPSSSVFLLQEKFCNKTVLSFSVQYVLVESTHSVQHIPSLLITILLPADYYCPSLMNDAPRCKRKWLLRGNVPRCYSLSSLL